MSVNFNLANWLSAVTPTKRNRAAAAAAAGKTASIYPTAPILSEEEAQYQMLEMENSKQTLKELEKLGRLEGCLEVCEKLLNAVPDSFEFKLLKAKYFVRLSRFEEAEKILKYIIQSQGDQSAQAMLVIGMMFYFSGEMESAITMLDRCLKMDEKMDEALELHAKAVAIRDKKKQEGSNE